MDDSIPRMLTSGFDPFSTKSEHESNVKLKQKRVTTVPERWSIAMSAVVAMQRKNWCWRPERQPERQARVLLRTFSSIIVYQCKLTAQYIDVGFIIKWRMRTTAAESEILPSSNYTTLLQPIICLPSFKMWDQCTTKRSDDRRNCQHETIQSGGTPCSTEQRRWSFFPLILSQLGNGLNSMVKS